MIRALVLASLLTASSLATAQSLHVQPVTEGVWAIVGEKDQRSPENLANNGTFGLVATEAGAVLIDPGDSCEGAEALHAQIRNVTSRPAFIGIWQAFSLLPMYSGIRTGNLAGRQENSPCCHGSSSEVGPYSGCHVVSDA